MKVLHLHCQGGGVFHFRHWLPARWLARNNVDITCFSSELGFFHELSQRPGGLDKWLKEEGWNFDAIHMGYSTILPQVSLINGALRNYAHVEHNHNLPIAVDIDDDPHSVPTYNTSFRAYTRAADEKKTLLIHLRTAEAVTITKDCLSKVLQRDGKNFTVLPNYCDPDDWQHYPVDPNRSDDKSVRVMYAGGQGHYGDLATIQEEMEILMHKYDGKEGRPMMRLFWLGCTPDWAAKWMQDQRDATKNRAFYIQPCHIKTYYRLLRWIKPDIMIAPVEHNTFNESKSCLKGYDSVAAGATLLCSDWPTYDVIPNDATFKFSNNIQFKETLEALILDPSLREKKAASLEEWALTERRIESHIYKWTEFYHKLREMPPVRGISDVVRPRIITEGAGV